MDLARTLSEMGAQARFAAAILAQSSSAQRDGALGAMAREIVLAQDAILSANAEDLRLATHTAAAFADRLALTPERIAAIAAGLDAVAARGDPLGRVLEEFERPNGLRIARVSVPLGVIGVIYESRPNVTADAGALCLKSGNAVILRGGSEALRTSLALHAAMARGLAAAGLPAACVQLVGVPDRDAVGHMLAGLGGAIDLIVPRGGKSLVKRVQNDARVPVLAHLEGVNHVYVHRAADPAKALAIVLNSKMRRVSVCGAAETVLIDADAPPSLKKALVLALLEAGCTIRGDGRVRALDARISPAAEADWATEYLDAVLSAREVEGVEDALAHIARYGSRHTDAIVTEDAVAAEAFLARVDSAIVLWNASTQFADGAEFGFGAEIGIATGKLHARGPVGADHLTSYKYVVRGHGQIRP